MDHFVSYTASLQSIEDVAYYQTQKSTCAQMERTEGHLRSRHRFTRRLLGSSDPGTLNLFKVLLFVALLIRSRSFDILQT